MENSRRWRPIRNEDFLESDVWEAIEESRKTSEPEQVSIGLLSRQLETAARLIPRAKNLTPELKLVQHSAPVNIPNWSKIYGKSPKMDSSRNSFFADQDWFNEEEDHESNDFDRTRFSNHPENSDDVDEEYEDDQDCRLPPHEWLAKKQTRNQISSFSVCEGVGRTLKGRDLSRVRHAVLTQTGFI